MVRGFWRSPLGGALSALLFGVGLGGCATDSPHAPRLRLVSQDPPEGGRLAADEPVLLRFATYLYPGTPPAGTVTLVSGEREVGVALLYDPAARGVALRPTEELLPGLAYTLTVAPEALFGYDGAVLPEPIVLHFVAETAAARPEPDPVDFEADLAPLFEARCACHGPAPLAYPALTETALVGRPSLALPYLSLVAPGLPLRSMLVRKILPGFPGHQGRIMPPADGDPLTVEERRLVVDWVAGLSAWPASP